MKEAQVKPEALGLIYQKLYRYFGPQHWWPGDSVFEVMVGAILTQNTNWGNVEKAINNLKKQRLLRLDRLHRLAQEDLSRLIVPAGYYNVKAKRLKEFFNFLFENYKGNLRSLFPVPVSVLRSQLLSVNGIGPETADSILLYALNKPIFVIDAYTKRIFARHKLIKDDASYEQAQSLFMNNLKANVQLFNEYHALLVRLAKEFCLKNKPRCGICPLNKIKNGYE